MSGKRTALFAVCAFACGRAPETLPPVRLELAELAGSARLWTESGEIDIGTPAARGALWSGWGPDEKSPAGATFAWGGGELSRLRFELAAPRPLRIRLRGWSFPFPD